MGELRYKARRLGGKIAGNMQQAAGRTSKHWQKEGTAQESNGARRAFLGRVVSVVGDD